MRVLRLLLRILFRPRTTRPRPYRRRAWSADRSPSPPTPPPATGPIPPEAPRPVPLRGRAWVIDGDTIVIDKLHIRLSGIDAPELDHPWGRKAKSALMDLCRGQIITAVANGHLSHDRAVAQCYLPDGRDLSAEMVRAGMALDWPAYSGGRYRHLEAPDARRRFWRADARQKGAVPQQTPGA